MKKLSLIIPIVLLLGVGCSNDQHAGESSSKQVEVASRDRAETNIKISFDQVKTADAANPGTNPQILAQAYVEALVNNDAQKLRSLIPPDLDAEIEIQEKLKQFGARPIGNITSDASGDFVPYRQTLSIQGKYLDDNSGFKDELTIQTYESARLGSQKWYIMLGCIRMSNGGNGTCVHPNFK